MVIVTTKTKIKFVNKFYSWASSLLLDTVDLAGRPKQKLRKNGQPLSISTYCTISNISMLT